MGAGHYDPPFHCTHSNTITMQESYEFVSRVVDSCHNGFHLECAKRCIDLFFEKYGDCELHHQLMEAYLAKEPLITVL